MINQEPKIIDEKILSKKCAWLYYVAKLNQNQIGQKVGLSKMRVHRLIAYAEKNGYVKTFVEGNFETITQYENILKKKNNLKICEIIPNDEEKNNPVEMLGAAGARFIMNQINEKNINSIGIGTGKTMNSVAKWLPKINKKIDFTCLHGSLTSYNSIQTETSIYQIAYKTDGECYHVGIPLMLDSIDQRRSIEKIKFVKEIMNKASSTKLKILGIGGLSKYSQIVRSKIFSEESIKKLKNAGAIGEVSGNFFDKNGKIISNNETQKIFGVKSDSIKNSKTVLIAGGKNKIQQIQSVLKSNLFTGLITDEETAKKL